MSLIAFVVIGLVAALVARAVMPGNASMGLPASTALGVVGAFVGGMLGSLLNTGGSYLAIAPSGLIFSIIGAMAVLALVSFSHGRRVV